MKANKGFTLIEVLIAAIILFSSLAITAQLFSASSLSADKAANAAQYYQSAELVITNIKSQLRERFEDTRQTEYNGITNVFGYQYEWHATVQEKITPPQSIDDDTPPVPRYPVFLVEVELSQANKKFQFKVVAW